MYEFKRSVAAFAPVKMVDTAGLGVTGLVYTDITLSVLKADGTVATSSPGVSDWVEATAGAFASQGIYAVRLSATDLGQAGMLVYAVSGGTAKTYSGAVEVVANIESETYAMASALSLISEGRWKIHTTGADAYRLVYYDVDGITPLKKFDLFDAFGAPTITSPFERVPVP
jgi:hypothetical protein